MLRYAAIAGLGAALGCVAPAFADIRAEQSDNVWQVSSEGERLSEVLAAIQSEAGFRLVGADRLIEDNPVSVDLTGPLDCRVLTMPSFMARHPKPRGKSSALFCCQGVKAEPPTTHSARARHA